MERNFDFCMPVHISFGEGVSGRAADFIDGTNVTIVCDPFLYKNGTARKIGEMMKGKTVAYFSEIQPNPSGESVDAAAKCARENHTDCVVGIGGGSALDVAKMTACLVSNKGSIYDYYSGGTKKLKKRKAELILIPTTAGTGSEVTNVGVYTNPSKHIKMPFVENNFWADYALIDSELTYTLPSPVTASTGMDAFCHAIEAYWNKESKPLCDYLSMGACKLILENIKKAYDTPDDREARGNMLLASLIAGVSFSQTRTTGIHALSFPLTVEYGASHGTACSITLPAFIKISAQQRPEKMLSLAKFLGYRSVSSLAKGVEELMKSMKMPLRLHEIGVKKEAIPHIATVGLGAAIIQLTPAEMNQKTVEALLASIL